MFYKGGPSKSLYLITQSFPFFAIFSLLKLNKKLHAATAESQRVSYTHIFLGSLTDRALHWTLHLLYNYIID